MQKKVGAWSGGKSWSAERRCQKGLERGAIFTPGRAPYFVDEFLDAKYRKKHNFKYPKDEPRRQTMRLPERRVRNGFEITKSCPFSRKAL